MKLSPEQQTLLAIAAVVFGLQALPHHVTTLHHGAMTLAYMLLVMLLVLTIGVCMVIAFLGVLLTPSGVARIRWGSWFVTFTLMLVGGGIVSVCNIAYARGLPVGSFARRFDAQAWAQPGACGYVPGDITPRQKMLGDVVQTVVKKNSRDAIEKLLGPSLDTSYFSESGRDLIYCTGPERTSFFAIDSEWLLIWLDSKGKVSRYKIYTD